MKHLTSYFRLFICKSPVLLFLQFIYSLFRINFTIFSLTISLNPGFLGEHLYFIDNSLYLL